MSFKSLSSQDLSQYSTSEVNNVILDPGFIKDGEDKGKQLENQSLVLLAHETILGRNKDTNCT